MFIFVITKTYVYMIKIIEGPNYFLSKLDYKISIWIQPYNSIEVVIRSLLFSNPPLFEITCNYEPKSYYGNSYEEWRKCFPNCIKIAKYLKTFLHASKEEKEMYNIQVESKLLWPNSKYSVIYEKDKRTILIKTGNHPNIPNPESLIRTSIEKMIWDIGIYQTQQICNTYSNFIDTTTGNM